MNKRRGIAVTLLVSYVLVRFFLTRQLDALGEYAGYLFEILFCAAAAWLYHGRIKVRFEFHPRLLFELIFVAIAGWAMYMGAHAMSLPIPFDMTSVGSVVFLGLIGPVLEEAIFRMALWESISELIPRTWFVLVTTSLLFAYAHFHVFWFVDDSIRPFLIYQTAYVLLIGWYFGFCRMRACGGLGLSVLAHIVFNAGFFLGFAL